MRVTGLPLEDGKVTCLTCHDPGALRGHDQKTGQGKSYIRDDEEGQSLCLRCHTSKQAAGHTTAYPWAHPARKSAKGGDRESDACLSCHDGALASDADAHRQRGLAEQSDHAVGTLFKAPANAESALVPVARLDRRVRLFDGKIGCGSCHSVYAPGDKKLVVSNKASQLCLKCHIE